MRGDHEIMLKALETTKMHSYPGMVAVIGTKGPEHSNFMAAGWHSFLSIEPPMYGVAIGRERFTYNCLKKNGEFTINFLPSELAEFIQLSGFVSGATTNKAEVAKMNICDGETVQAPYLADAYVVYECKVNQFVDTGDHDWVVGSITKCYANTDLFREDGLPDLTKFEIPLYLGRSKYVTLDNKADQFQFTNPYNSKEKS